LQVAAQGLEKHHLGQRTFQRTIPFI